MGMHRKNKAPRVRGDRSSQPWFDSNVKRQRARRDMAKASKRKNRK